MIALIKKDTVLRGLILGLIAPVIGFYLYKISFFNYFDMPKFFNHLVSNNLLSPVISLCLIFNAGAFYFFIKKNKLYSARGLVLATFLYGGVIVYLKFFHVQ